MNPYHPPRPNQHIESYYPGGGVIFHQTPTQTCTQTCPAYHAPWFHLRYCLQGNSLPTLCMRYDLIKTTRDNRVGLFCFVIAELASWRSVPLSVIADLSGCGQLLGRGGGLHRPSLGSSTSAWI